MYYVEYGETERRILTTDTLAASLQFILRFMQLNLDTLCPEEWRTLRTDLGAFLGLSQTTEGRPTVQTQGGLFFWPDEGWTPGAMSEPDIRALQSLVQRLITGIVLNREAWQRHEDTKELTADHPPVVPLPRCCQLFAGYPQTTALSLGFQGPFPHLFLFGLCLLLSQEPSDRILRCPGCRTIFYRVHKRQYCQRACGNRATLRKWRQSPRGKASETRRQRARYAKQKAPAQVRPRRPRRGDASHGETPRQP